MEGLRVALVQIDATVGALASNAAKITLWAHEAAGQGAQLIVFPEHALCGYPPEDLVLKPHFIEDCERQLAELAPELPQDRVVVVGSPRPGGGGVHNAAAVFHGGELIATYRKMLLPNYGVFDEKRVFIPGDQSLVLDIDGARVALHICEDSWDPEQASCTQLKDQGLDAVVNLSASPYHGGKVDQRLEALEKTAVYLDAHLLYCNLVGGQDELVFDGTSKALDNHGEVVARARQFEEDMLVIDIPCRSAAGSANVEVVRVTPAPPAAHDSVDTVIQPLFDHPADIYRALTLGLHDYVDKNGFERVLVAISGGIDSALVAALAVDALGKERVVGITMPSKFNSGATLEDAGKLAQDMDIEFLTLPIKDLYNRYLELLSPLWPGREPDIAEENIQARVRGNLIMALSNKFHWMVLATGNKSEMATGYCTLYGDMVGGFNVLKDVPKTLVFELARWRNEQGDAPAIPPSIIERAPSAELRDDQKDSDSLPPYDELDPILERYVEMDMSVDDIVADGFDEATVRRVARLVDVNEYKRRQGAPGIKITPKAFGRDRRLPITNLYGRE